MSAPIVLLLGVGANIGLSLAKKFTAEGWKVAAVARTIRDEVKQNSTLQISADFSDSNNVEKAYKETETKLGTPNVIIYNSASVHLAKADGLLDSVSVADFAHDLAINVTAPYAAAKLAVEGFKKLSTGVPRVFIMTGNIGTSIVTPEFFTLFTGKNAAFSLLESAAKAYGHDYQFYYADERYANGSPLMNNIHGEAHAEAYWTLANSKEQLPVQYTFVEEKGYQKFDVDHIRPHVAVAKMAADAKELEKQR